MKLTKNTIATTLLALSVVSCGGGGGSDSSSNSNNTNNNQTPSNNEPQTNSSINPGWSYLYDMSLVYLSNDNNDVFAKSSSGQYYQVLPANKMKKIDDSSNVPNTDVTNFDTASKLCLNNSGMYDDSCSASFSNSVVYNEKTRYPLRYFAKNGNIQARLHGSSFIFISIDSGNSFYLQDINISRNVLGRDCDTKLCSKTPASIYIASDNTILFTTNGTGLFRSIDLGSSWQEDIQDIGIVEVLVQNHTNRNVFYALTEDRLVYASTDSGLTWGLINFNSLAESEKQWRSMDIDSNGVLALINDKGIIFESSDSGETWSVIANSDKMSSVIQTENQFLSTTLTESYGYVQQGDLYFSNITNPNSFLGNVADDYIEQGGGPTEFRATLDYYYTCGYGCFRIER